MFGFILRRIAGLLLVMVGVSIITFSLAHLVPIDPAAAALGQNARDEQIAAYRQQLGLDRPVVEQYLTYMRHLLQGDMGISIRTHRPVIEDLKDFFPATMELSMAALMVAILVGLPLGIAAALRRNSWVDALARFLALVGGSIPIFYLGLLLISIFYRQLHWLPGPGRLDTTMSPPETITGLYTVDAFLTGNWQVLQNSLYHLILPAITLGYFSMAVLLRMTRSSMLEVWGQDYVRTARAKGLAYRVVVWRHGLRNALPPILTTIGVTFGSLLAGAVLTETIFSWPGLGRYATTSVTNLDFPAVMGVTLLAAIIYPLANTLVDIGYTFVDPRIRVQ
jgi:peptide/nickel transport system permease protein